MEEGQQTAEKQILYPNLSKIGDRYQLFVSQPFKYIGVFLLVQLSIILYFLVTSKTSNLAIKVITIILYAVLTLLNLAFAVVDPGIIPKFRVARKYDEIPLNYEQVRQNRRGGIFQKRQYNMTIKTHYLDLRYCGNCSVYRPPRTVHCYSCGVCIQKLDHHCPWLGMCIGKRNYGLYLAYIIAMQVMSILFVAQTIVFMKQRQMEDQKVQYAFNIILLIVSALTAVFVATLIVVHFKLSIQNLTTKQIYHGKWEISSGNPYEKASFIQNWIDIFNKFHPSKFTFQQAMQKGKTASDHSFVHTQMDTNKIAEIEIKELKLEMSTPKINKEKDNVFPLRESQHNLQ